MLDREVPEQWNCCAMLSTPPNYILTVPESCCKVARLPAYGLIWLPDRRCSGPGCISTAHLGKPNR